MKPSFSKAKLDEDEDSIINEELFEKWLDAKEDRLGDYRFTGKKYLLNSPWQSDYKRHLALLPQRFKYGRYRCFKTGKNGSLIDFVMEIDGVGFVQALSLIAPSSVRPNSRKKHLAKTKISSFKASWNIDIPKGSILMDRCHIDGTGALRKAARYLIDRRIDPKRTEVYYCPDGRRMPDGRWQDISNRLVFPFRDEDGQLYYWTARAVSPWQEPRYLEPHESEGGAMKESVLYIPDWDIGNRATLILEGPIDAISLASIRFPVVSIQGSNFYSGQMDILKSMNVIPVWAFDTDLPGIKATVKAYEVWRDESYFVFSPAGMDWNKMLVDMGVDAVKQHIVNNIRPLDESAIFHLRSQISCLDKTTAINRKPRKKH